MKILGYIPVKIRKVLRAEKAQAARLVIIDSAKRFKPLAGRTFLDLLYPNWRVWFGERINKVDEGKYLRKDFDVKRFCAKLQTDYPTVFSKSATKPISHFKVHVDLIEGAKPIFHKPYTLSYGMREKVEKELRRLTDLGTIYTVMGNTVNGQRQSFQ